MGHEIAELYIKCLEEGNIDKLLSLFASNAIVHSPIYGIKPASEFYHLLADDTVNSKLDIKGIFEEKKTGSIALFFNYIWTIKNGKEVNFDVVDIIKLDKKNKISELTIIYDTIHTRVEINQ